VNLHLRPTFSALLREGAGPLLVAVQVAIALAVMVNAVYVLTQRLDRIGRPTGMEIENAFVIRSLGFTAQYRHEPTILADLAYLRSVPDVVAVTTLDYLPLSGNGNRTRVMLEADDLEHAARAAIYEIDDQGLDALGVRQRAGRNFRPEEILPSRASAAAPTSASQVLITQALAEDLFADGQAVGKGVHALGPFLSKPAIVTGVIENMHGHPGLGDKLDRVVLIPRLPYPDEPAAHYVVRVRPGRMASVMRAVEQHFAKPDPDRVIEWIRPYEFFKNRVYLGDRIMAVYLVVVTMLLLTIASLGIYGLTTFNVSTRAKQIGVRRALGARRIDIIAQFIVENWLVTTAGIIVGCMLALAAGFWLSSEYQLPRLDLYYLAGGIPLLWFVALLASWYPARRAAAISPAAATRTA
jgi:putative ABC transport system permease protein